MKILLRKFQIMVSYSIVHIKCIWIVKVLFSNIENINSHFYVSQFNGRHCFADGRCLF